MDLPILILLVPLTVYLIWNHMEWNKNKIIDERKKIYKDLKDSLEDFKNSLEEIGKNKN